MATHGNLELRRSLVAGFEEVLTPYALEFVAGSRGFIDDVIMPHGTRRRLCRSLARLREKHLTNPWKKHANIPL